MVDEGGHDEKMDKYLFVDHEFCGFMRLHGLDGDGLDIE
jgi:hypothetical protein